MQLQGTQDSGLFHEYPDNIETTLGICSVRLKTAALLRYDFAKRWMR